MKRQSHIPIESIEMSTVERFDSIAASFAEKTAIRFGNNELTYSELQTKSNILAQHISAIQTEQRQIAFFLSFGIDQFVALFGILKARCAYVPIDTSWPAHRIEHSINDSHAKVVITDNANLGQVKALCTNRLIINIDEIDFAKNTAQPESYPTADDIQHILYTSGSTGEPKGVYTNHRNQLHFVKRFSEFIDLGPDDTFAYYFSIGFSAHAMPSLGTLLTGGTLVMYDLKKNGFQGLAEFFNREKVTVCLMIPSVLRHFRATLDQDSKLNKLRILLVGGETLYFNDIKQILPFLKRKAEIINIYASTEMYLSFAYRIKNDTVLNQNIIPIGHPVEGIQLEIHNEDGQECEPDQVGEMIIYSPYSALGYWNNPEMTAQDFQQTDQGWRFNSRDLAYKRSDGAFVHVGRKDSMVKIRGQRVDLGEVENSILFNSDIQDVAVALKEGPLGNKHLVAYYVCRSGIEIKTNVIKVFLTRRLPDYMVPSFVIKLDALPKTDSGKTDYKLLPDPDWKTQSQNTDFQHARTVTESEIIAIFEQQLGVSPIGITDNILETGNDSLKLFVAFDTIEKHFNIKVDLDLLTRDPSIQALAKRIDDLKK